MIGKKICVTMPMTFPLARWTDPESVEDSIAKSPLWKEIETGIEYYFKGKKWVVYRRNENNIQYQEVANEIYD